MKNVEMEHVKSKMTITVAASQVGNAKYYGWTECKKAPAPVKFETSKGNENGESKRK